MSQKNRWELEYQDPKLVATSFEPTKDAKDFARFLKKKCGTVEDMRVLDLGSGIGKNAHFFAERGANVTGIEISDSAREIAEKQAKDTDVTVIYKKGNIGAPLPFPDKTFDAILDVLSSNSLSEEERVTYLKESARVLKSGGHMLVKALCKDGDKNAKELLKKFPGKEKDTYTLPQTGIMERVFSESDLRALYSTYFTIISLKKTSHYPRVSGRLYKRNYFVLMLQKLDKRK